MKAREVSIRLEVGLKGELRHLAEKRKQRFNQTRSRVESSFADISHGRRREFQSD